MNKNYIIYINKFFSKKVVIAISIIFFLFGFSKASYNCGNFNVGNGIYAGLTTQENNLVGDDCMDILEYYKNSDTNGIHYGNFMDDITGQNNVSYSNVKTLTGDFLNIYENTNSLEYGGNGFSALLWYNKGITYWTKDLFIGPNIQYIFPFKPIYTNLKYVPVIVYNVDNQLPRTTDLKMNIYVSDKDMPLVEENINMMAKAKLSNIPVGNGKYSVFGINIDELRGKQEEGDLYIYAVSKNIYGNKSSIIKSKISYNRVQLKSVLGYTPDYIDYDNKKWTRNADVNFLYLYTNLKPKTVESNNEIKVSLSEITTGAYSVGNEVYKYKAKLYLYNLKQGLNSIDVKVGDIYGNINKHNTIDVYVDSKGPLIVKSDIKSEYSVSYDNKIYINPTTYKANGGFDMILNVQDEATKTEKIVVKTDLGKKIVIDMKDGQDYDLKQLETSFDENGEKILQIEAYDILGNISKTTKYYNTLNISYPVITFPPKDNLIVVNNSLDFKGLCSGVSKADIMFKLNDKPKSGWINYQDNWDINQLLTKGYNLFKVKCKNIVGESDYVERIVIYEPKENIGGKNYQLEMYPSESNEFIMNRSNKNADNDTLKITDPIINKNIPGFSGE